MLKKSFLISIATFLALTTCLAADFLKDFQAAMKLHDMRKNNESFEAFLKLAEVAPTAKSKSECLKLAVSSLCRAKRFDEAMELTKTIPIEPLAKNCRMGIMMNSGKFKELIETFKDEDIDVWPESCQSEGFLRRGTAYLFAGDGEAATVDLEKAARHALDDRPRLNALSRLADAFASMGDDAKALETYKRVQDEEGFESYHTFFHATLKSAEILSRQGKRQEALAELAKMNVPSKAGDWYFRMLLSQGDILREDGKVDEAMLKYQEASKVEKVHPALMGLLRKQIEGMRQTRTNEQ